jgi:hypothetical protein
VGDVPPLELAGCGFWSKPATAAKFVMTSLGFTSITRTVELAQFLAPAFGHATERELAA